MHFRSETPAPGALRLIALDIPHRLALLIGLLAAIAAPVFGATTTVVVDGSSTEWAFLPETGTPSGYFDVGPDTPPEGAGSALLLTDDSADGIAIISQELISTPLADFTSLSYWTHTSSPPQAPALQFSVDYDDTDMDESWQGRLVYEPYRNGTVLADTWQQWDTIDSGSGEWWATGEPGKTSCPMSSPCTWADILATFPNAAIHGPALGQFLVKSGSGWGASQIVTHTDAIAATTSGGVDVVYDFETTSAQVNISELSENGWFSDDTRADGTSTMPEAVGTNLVSPTLTDDPEATASGNADHDDDVLNQIDFLFFGPPVDPPADEFQGAAHLSIAGGVNDGKSQISHRNDPDETLDADGFGYGHEILNGFFQAKYSWMGDGTSTVTASLKLGFKTTELGATGVSSRTGENAWDKILIYEPGNGNGATSDGTWQTVNVNFTTGDWWLFDRTAPGGTQGSPMPLSEMSGSGVAVGGGGKTVADVWALLTDSDGGEEAILTSIQLGIGSFNQGGSVYVNQLETSFYRKGMITTFGTDPDASTVICVPSSFDAECEVVEATIQDALDTEGLGAEDIVMVDSGTYVGNLSITTGVMLVGPNAGVSGCGRVAAEAAIQGTTTVSAPDVVIDGFTLDGLVYLAGASDRLTVANNRIVGSIGDQVVVGAASSDVTLADNELVGGGGVAALTKTSVQSQVSLQADVPGLYIVRNCFREAAVASIALDLADVDLSPSGSRSPVVSSNLFHDTGGGLQADIGTVSSTEISGNSFRSLSGTAITGRLVDSLVLDNRFEDGAAGGVDLSSSSAGNSSDTSVFLNCFFGNAGTAIQFAATGAEDTHMARFNDIVGNTIGASYAGAEVIDVRSNWWGAAGGPSGDGPGSGDPVAGAGLDVTPFQVVPQTYGTLCSPVADLTLTKVDDIPYGDAEDNDAVTYTITVGNLGPQDATGAQVTDTLPAGLAGCTWTCTPSGDASCGSANGAGNISETVDVPVGDTVVFELSCTIDRGGLERILNTASVAAGGELDEDGDNSAASEVIDFPMFADGFESGNTSAWSTTVP